MSWVPCEVKFIIVINSAQIDEQLPMRRDRAAQSAPAFFAALVPHFGFLHAEPHKQGEQRRDAAQEETAAANPKRWNRKK